MAAAGISYTVGREANETYGETYNGVQLLEGHQFPDGVDPYQTPGDPTSGLLWGISNNQLAEQGSGDKLVQAYNFRICLTNAPENMLPIKEPENYDVTRYELLARLFEAQPKKRKLGQYFIWSNMETICHLCLYFIFSSRINKGNFLSVIDQGNKFRK